MTIDQLVFVGFNGYVVALDRDTGQTVWATERLRYGYVSLLLDGDRLIVSANGYIYCLDPLTGVLLWENPLRGYGTGTASLASVRGQGEQAILQQAAEEAARQASNTNAASSTQ